MNRKEVEEKTRLSRKAIEYYEEVGFICPKRNKNNYRIYSKEEVNKLYKISIFRRLGLNVAEIKEVLENSLSANLVLIKEKQIKQDIENQRILLLEEYIKGTIKDIDEQLKILEREDSIYNRLIKVFPGYFGQLMFMSYKPFLDTKVEDEKAFGEYISFLDNMDKIQFNEEEILFLNKVYEKLEISDLEDINLQKIKSIENYKNWYTKNQQQIEEYMNFKDSKEYKESIVNSIQQKIKKHMEDTKYYEIAIPLLRKFSKKYDAYYIDLLKADNYLITKLKDKLR